MYAGHFAAAVTLRAKSPHVPFWGILIGVGLLDLLFGPFLLLRIEHASLTPGVPPGFSLDYIGWSHSLLMAIIWSLAYGALFLKRGGRVVAVILLGCAFYTRHARRSGTFGGRPLVLSAVIVLLHVVNSPWLSQF